MQYTEDSWKDLDIDPRFVVVVLLLEGFEAREGLTPERRICYYGDQLAIRSWLLDVPIPFPLYRSVYQTVERALRTQHLQQLNYHQSNTAQALSSRSSGQLKRFTEVLQDPANYLGERIVDFRFPRPSDSPVDTRSKGSDEERLAHCLPNAAFAFNNASAPYVPAWKGVFWVFPEAEHCTADYLGDAFPLRNLEALVQKFALQTSADVDFALPIPFHPRVTSARQGLIDRGHIFPFEQVEADQYPPKTMAKKGKLKTGKRGSTTTESDKEPVLPGSRYRFGPIVKLPWHYISATYTDKRLRELVDSGVQLTEPTTRYAASARPTTIRSEHWEVGIATFDDNLYEPQHIWTQEAVTPNTRNKEGSLQWKPSPLLYPFTLDPLAEDVQLPRAQGTGVILQPQALFVVFGHSKRGTRSTGQGLTVLPKAYPTIFDHNCNPRRKSRELFMAGEPALVWSVDPATGLLCRGVAAFRRFLFFFGKLGLDMGEVDAMPWVESATKLEPRGNFEAVIGYQDPQSNWPQQLMLFPDFAATMEPGQEARGRELNRLFRGAEAFANDYNQGRIEQRVRFTVMHHPLRVSWDDAVRKGGARVPLGNYLEWEEDVSDTASDEGKRAGQQPPPTTSGTAGQDEEGVLSRSEGWPLSSKHGLGNLLPSTLMPGFIQQSSLQQPSFPPTRPNPYTEIMASGSNKSQPPPSSPPTVTPVHRALSNAPALTPSAQSQIGSVGYDAARQRAHERLSSTGSLDAAINQMTVHSPMKLQTSASSPPTPGSSLSIPSDFDPTVAKKAIMDMRTVVKLNPHNSRYSSQLSSLEQQLASYLDLQRTESPVKPATGKFVVTWHHLHSLFKSFDTARDRLVSSGASSLEVEANEDRFLNEVRSLVHPEITFKEADGFGQAADSSVVTENPYFVDRFWAELKPLLQARDVKGGTAKRARPLEIMDVSRFSDATFVSSARVQTEVPQPPNDRWVVEPGSRAHNQDVDSTTGPWAHLLTNEAARAFEDLQAHEQITPRTMTLLKVLLNDIAIGRQHMACTEATKKLLSTTLGINLGNNIHLPLQTPDLDVKSTVLRQAQKAVDATVRAQSSQAEAGKQQPDETTLLAQATSGA